MSTNAFPFAGPPVPVKDVSIARSVEAGELGVIAGLVFRNFVTGETINVMPVSYSELRRITRQDGQARGLLRLLTMPVTNAKWDLLSSSEDKEVAGGAKQKDVVGTDSSDERDFIAENLFNIFDEGGMSIPFSDVIACLSLAVRDGFKVFEKVFRLNDRGRIILQKLAYRDNDTVTLLADDHGDFAGFRQQTHFGGRNVDVTLGRDKALIYTFGKEESPLYGSPLFLPVYYHMDKKHKLYYISHIAYQMLAIPPRMGKVPAGSDPNVRGKFLRDLATLGFNAALTMPSDFEVEPFESKRSLADFIPLIEHHNMMAAKAVLGQFMDLQVSATGKLAGEQSDVFVMGIVQMLKDFEKLFNNWVIPQLVSFNFGNRNFPKLRARAFTDSDQQTLKEIFVDLMTAGANHVSPEFLAKLEQKMAGQMDIKNIDYDAVEKKMIENADAVQEANLKAMTMKQQQAAGGNKQGGRPKGKGKQSGSKEGNA